MTVHTHPSPDNFANHIGVRTYVTDTSIIRSLQPIASNCSVTNLTCTQSD